MHYQTANEQDLNQRPKHILIVEDSVALRFVLGEWLRSLDYIVYEAATADEAVTVLSSLITVDFVVTDVHMPGSMDGFDLVRHIRKTLPDLNVVVVSSEIPQTKIREEEVVFFHKPYDLEALSLHIAKNLKKSHKDDEALS